MAKTIKIERGEFELRWTNGPKGSQECYVDIYKSDECIAERSYPRLNSLPNTAVVFSDQALSEAKLEVDRG